VGALLFVAAPLHGRAFTISYTLPDHSVKTVLESDGTISRTCEPDSATDCADLHWVRAYMYSSGSWVKVREKDVSGRAGQADTLNVPDMSSYFLTTLDDSLNESCASPVIHDPGLITGVPDGEGPPHVIETAIFTVRGERVPRPGASGVYFYRTKWSDGHYTIEKRLWINW